MDYEKLGLKCGIEIHKQLDTKHKLFCSCVPRLSDMPVFDIRRKLRAVAGELGDIDAAALHEVLKSREFFYKAYPEETCLVEMDSEPPHELNREALDTVLQIALMLNCEIPDEIHIMRKTVIDGSNTSGFQRTAIVGMNGWIETGFGRVGIDNVSIEEESSQILDRKKGCVVYGLDRLGIPLVEIGTASDIKAPEQAKEVAEKLGMMLKSTGKVKAGLGTIRQDLNVSIKGGSRVEIKGVQELKMIPKIIEMEVGRQKGLVERGEEVTKDVRRALPGGETEFLRPLPGAARLYPETDMPPIRVERKGLEGIRKAIPETLDMKAARLVKQYRISEEVVKQLVGSGRAGLFEEVVKMGTDPGIVSRTLTATLKELGREGVKVDILTDYRIMDIFSAFKKKRVKDIPKEALVNILKELASRPGQDIGKLIEKAEGLSEAELRKVIKGVIEKNRQALKSPRPEKALMGLVMREVRGKAPGSLVMKVLMEEIRK
jgi:Glu-tRNA(Gln) amidotransferase subunit E-like FAD-binding protein